MIVSGDRFLAELEALGQIGWVEGEGMNRPAFTPSYEEAREFVAGKMRDAGFSVRVDGVGNLFGRIEGSDSSLPVILAGSHLDAVPGGGKYDGPLGVMAALEAARSIKEKKLPSATLLKSWGLPEKKGERWGARSAAGHLPG